MSIARIINSIFTLAAPKYDINIGEYFFTTPKYDASITNMFYMTSFTPIETDDPTDVDPIPDPPTPSEPSELVQSLEGWSMQ